MPYKTIVIIEYAESVSDKSSKTDLTTKWYLTIKEKEYLKFWDYTTNAFGAQFDYYEMIEKFTAEFKEYIQSENSLPKEEDFRHYKNSNPLNPGIRSKVYIVSLNKTAFENIRSDKFSWVDEKELEANKGNWQNDQEWILAEKHLGFSNYLVDPFTKQFKATVLQIQEAQKKGSLVIFVGAGLSCASGMPSWNGLIESLSSELDNPPEDKLLVPLIYSQEYERHTYIQKISTILNASNPKFNILHESLFKLKPCHVISTNYDNLLESSLNQSGKKYSIVSKDEDLPMTESPNLVIKMHGDLDNSNIVLHENDYIRYSDNFPLIESFVKGVFASKLVLFIGFSFEDPNLKKIIDVVHSKLGTKHNLPILFDDNNKIQEKKWYKKYYKKQGLKIISYEDTIDEYLQRTEEFDSDKFNLTERSKKLYLFLEFLRIYEENNIIEKSSSTVLEKMQVALQKFSDLPSIPPSYFEKIQPFSIDSNYQTEYDSDGFHLRISDDNIINYLKSIYKKVNGTFKLDLNLLSQEDTLLFKDVTSKLVSSGVHCIQRIHQFKDTPHYRIVGAFESKCNCPTCLLTRNDFKQLIVRLKEEDYTNGSAFHYLNIAYGYFFLRDFESCFKALHKGSNIAYSHEEYHLYYIFLYNIKGIHYRIKGLEAPTQITIESKKYILQHIKDVNLNDTIANLPLGAVSKNILHDIQYRKFYHETSDRLHELAPHVRKIYEIYKTKGNVHFGAAQFYKMKWIYLGYINFIRTNRLFDSFYNYPQKVTVILLISLVDNLKTSDEYSGKVKEINSGLIECIVSYSQSAELLNNLLKLHRASVRIQCSNIDDLINWMYQFINSLQYENAFFKSSTHLEPGLNSYRSMSFSLNGDLRRLFSNVLIITSSLKINAQTKPSHYDRLVISILKYMLVYPSWPFQDHNHYNLFVKYAYFDTNDELCDILIDVCLSPSIRGGELFETTINRIRRDNPNYIIPNEKFDEILRIAKNTGMNLFSIEDIVPIYHIVSKSNSSKFLRYIEKLDDDKIFLKAFQYELRFKNYQNILISKIEESIERIKKENYSQHTQSGSTYLFISWLLHYSASGLDMSIEFNQKLPRGFYQWLITPELYDSKDIQCQWISVIKSYETLVKFHMYRNGPATIKAIKNCLQNEYDKELAETLLKY